MLFKARWISLAFIASQASALTLLERRSFEFLQTRQSCTDICNSFSTSISGCTTAACVCTPAVANMLQSCVSCAVKASPTASVEATAQELISTYEDTCAGVVGLPAVTIPGGSVATTATAVGSTPVAITRSAQSVTIGLPSGTTTSPKVTVSNATPTVVIANPKSTVSDLLPTVASPVSTGGGGGGGDVPGFVKSDGTRSFYPSLAVAFGALIGAAFVL